MQFSRSKSVFVTDFSMNWNTLFHSSCLDTFMFVFLTDSNTSFQCIFCIFKHVVVSHFSTNWKHCLLMQFSSVFVTDFSMNWNTLLDFSFLETFLLAFVTDWNTSFRYSFCRFKHVVVTHFPFDYIFVRSLNTVIWKARPTFEVGSTGKCMHAMIVIKCL